MCLRRRKKRPIRKARNPNENAKIRFSSTGLHNHSSSGNVLNIVRQCLDPDGTGDLMEVREPRVVQTEMLRPDVEDNFRCLFVASWKKEHSPKNISNFKQIIWLLQCLGVNKYDKVWLNKEKIKKVEELESEILKIFYNFGRLFSVIATSGMIMC